MGVSGEFGVSWAVCLAPVSQTAGVWCKSFLFPPLRQRQLQPWATISCSSCALCLGLLAGSQPIPAAD